MSLARSKVYPLEALGLAGGKRSGDLQRALGTLREVTGGLRAALHQLRGHVEALRPARRAPALELDLPDRTLRFRGITEFEFALSSKTEYPVGRVAELLPRSPADLRKVATHIRQVEKRFAEVLTDSMHEPGLVSELMREVGIKLFSKDHGWRDLIEGLNQCGPAYDEYKRLALVKYMQYLGSRQDVLRSIYLDKIRDGARTALAEVVPAPAWSTHETELFDASSVGGAVGDAVDTWDCYRALERGETVIVHIPPGEAVELRLSVHPFRLYGGQSHYLVDENGAEHLLRPGKNMVGRQVDGDVVVDPQLRAVSRRHLIIETIDEETVALTDVSAHGTSMLDRLAGI